MSEKLLEYFIKHTDKKFDELHQRIGNIDSKVDVLLAFKWKIIGGSIVLSVLINLTIAIMSR